MSIDFGIVWILEAGSLTLKERILESLSQREVEQAPAGGNSAGQANVARHIFSAQNMSSGKITGLAILLWLAAISLLHAMLNLGLFNQHDSQTQVPFRAGFIPVTCHLVCS